MAQLLSNGMNEEQYKIVSFFLKMGSTAKQIAAGFGIKYEQVVEVEDHPSWEAYNNFQVLFGGKES